MIDYYPEEEIDSNYDLYDMEEEWVDILLPFVILGAVCTVLINVITYIVEEVKRRIDQ